MILAAVALIAAAAAVLLVFDPFDGWARDAWSGGPASDEPVSGNVPPGETDDTPAREPSAGGGRDAPDAAPPAAARDATTMPAREPGDAPAPDASRGSDQERIPPTTVTVRAGDTLFDIAGERWGDPLLWPLLLQANEGDIRDPDYLRPGQRVYAPGWVTVESGLTPEQRERLSQAHVLAYHHYRGLGDEAIGLGVGRPAWWLAQLAKVRLNKAMWVLYSGLRYDASLLDRFADRVRDEDAAQVRAFVERFGLPPAGR